MITPVELLARIVDRRRPILAVGAAVWGISVLQGEAEKVQADIAQGEEQLAEMQARYDQLQARVATLRAGAERLEARILDRLTADPALDAGWLNEILTDLFGEPDPEPEPEQPGSDGTGDKGCPPAELAGELADPPRE